MANRVGRADLRMYDYSPQWVVKDKLAKSGRPGRELRADQGVPRAVVDEWIKKVQRMGVQSIICLLDDEHLHLYNDLPAGLLDYYRQNGFAVVHLPVRDPAHHPEGQKTLEENLEKAWQAFQDLPGPVLVHCSAGIDRTGRVIEYIRSRLDEEGAGGKSDVR